LVIARFVWTTQVWLLPYLLFWAWVLVLSLRLVRRPDLLAVGRGRGTDDHDRGYGG
jgi:hypothetical protein